VPKADFVLAELPAEKDLRALGVLGGEVHEACVGVLHLDAELVQLVHELENRPGCLERFCLKLSRPCWIEATAVSGHALPNGVEAALEAQRDAPRLDEPLDERTHLRQRLVRLLGREVPHALIVPHFLDAYPHRVPIRTLLALALTTLLVTGCGERSEPVGELPPEYPVTVRGGADEPTTLSAQPDRIVALAPESAEILGRLGLGARLVGVPAGVSDAPANAKPVASASGQVEVSEVVGLDPDLLVATGTTDPVDVALATRRTGAALYEQPADSVNDVERAVVEVGFLVGEPFAARRLAGQIERRVTDVQRQVSDEPVTTAFVDTGFFVTVPARSLLGDLVIRAGGRSVGGPTPGFEPFDLDELLELDPDVYLATSDSRVTLRRLRAHPKTRRLSAVREGRFVVLEADLVTSAGPRVPEALAAVARALHPNALP
jgi:iron complex transport system substrate-binding protein